MQQHRSAREIDAYLGDVDVNDRIIHVCASMVRRESEGRRAVASMIGLVAAISDFLTLGERYMVAELLRDTADRIERCDEKERV